MPTRAFRSSSERSGGLGLLVGPAGLFLVDRGRDPDLSDAAERSLGGPFLAMLFLTSLTGLALLVLREKAYMPALLVFISRLCWRCS